MDRISPAPGQTYKKRDRKTDGQAGQMEERKMGREDVGQDSRICVTVLSHVQCVKTKRAFTPTGSTIVTLCLYPVTGSTVITAFIPIDWQHCCETQVKQVLLSNILMEGRDRQSKEERKKEGNGRMEKN